MQHFSIEIEPPLEERMPQQPRSKCHHNLGLAFLIGAVATCVYYVAAGKGEADSGLQEMGRTSIAADDVKHAAGPEQTGQVAEQAEKKEKKAGFLAGNEIRPTALDGDQQQQNGAASPKRLAKSLFKPDGLAKSLIKRQSLIKPEGAATEEKGEPKEEQQTPKDIKTLEKEAAKEMKAAEKEVPKIKKAAEKEVSKVKMAWEKAKEKKASEKEEAKEKKASEKEEASTEKETSKEEASKEEEEASEGEGMIVLKDEPKPPMPDLPPMDDATAKEVTKG